MTRNKILSTLLAVVLVVAFTFTTVFADGELPGRNPPVLGSEIIPDANPSPSISLINYNTTPTFRFTELPGATKYKIEVFNESDGSLLYTYKGVGVCSGGYCSLTPATVLGVYKWKSTTGYYYWHVKAKSGGFWQPTWSSNQYFYVVADGFVSNFNVDKKGWKPLNGEWSLANSAYLKGVGTDTATWYSVLQKNWTYDFVYQVRMKRPSGTQPNAIIFWGTPELDAPLNSAWESGVYFQYNNNQNFAIWRKNGDSWEFIVPYTISEYINPYLYNTLTVVVRYPYQHYFINGHYLGYTDITSPSVGWAGVSFLPSAAGDTLLIDKATLEAIDIFTALIPDPAMKLGDDPAPEGMVPWEAP